MRFNSMVELLRARSSEAGPRTAFRFLADGTREAESITYAGLDARARALAAHLQQLDLQGERALLLYTRELDFIVAFLACLYAGVVAVPAYPPRSARGLPRLLVIAKDAQPRAVLTSVSLLPRIRSWWAASTGEEAPGHWIASDEVPEEEAGSWRDPGLGPDALAFLQYTSGSTADPKGVMVSHSNLLHNERAIRAAFDQHASSVIVGWLPLFHDMGLIGTVLQPLYSGAQAVLMSPGAFLQQPIRWLEAISHYRADTSGGPNFAFDLAVRKTLPEQRETLDLSCWRIAFNGAEPVQHAVLERFVETYAPCGFRRESFFPCYGLAEATLLVSGTRREALPVVRRVSTDALATGQSLAADPTDATARPLVSSGRIAADTIVRIVRPATGEICAPSEIGEIYVAGPSVTGGYWKQPAATERTFGARVAAAVDGTPGEGPFLRTGDLGFLADGELFVTGRLKDLIILRGRNFYPQDIEGTVARCHPSLRPDGTGVFAVELEGGERLVVAAEVERHLAAEQFPAVCFAVRQAVSEEYEIAVHAVVLLRAGTLPKTSSGKIRRLACRAAYLGGELEPLWQDTPHMGDATAEPAAATGQPPGQQPADGTAAEPQLPEILAALRAAVARRLRLRSELLDPLQPLAGMGLDSLAAVELSHDLEAAYGARLSFEDLLAGHSLSSLAEELLARRSEKSSPKTVAPPEDLLPQPLSRGQKALWLADRQRPQRALYNIAVAASVQGELDDAALERTFSLLIERHAALRTTFGHDGGDPFLRVRASIDGWFVAEDVAGWSDTRIGDHLAAQAFRPFDLERGPLLRLLCLRRSAGEYVVLFVVHHLVADFWSMSILAREMGLLCRRGQASEPADRPSLPPLLLTYSAHVAWLEEWLAGERGEEAARYWEAQLAGAPTALHLPVDHPRPATRSHRGATCVLDLPASAVDRLRALSAANQVSVFTTLLSAFQALLHRYTGQEDLLVGVPSAGRALSELAGVVGYFVNPLVLRADLRGDPDFSELLARNRTRVLGAFAHQAYPFGALVERLRPEREGSASPLFQVLFSFQQGRPDDAPGLAAFALGAAGASLEIGGLTLHALDLPERRAQFDLTLAIAPLEEGLRAVLEYDTDLFDRPGMLRLVDHFGRLLAAMTAEPGRRVSEQPLLSPAERSQLLVEWNAAPRPPRSPACLHQLVAAQAAATPDEVAIVAQDRKVTYRELERRSNQLARHLRSLGVGPERIVGVALARSPELIIALLGTLKAGGAYLPLDVAYPRERLAFMLEDAGCQVLVTGPAVCEQLPEIDRPVVLLTPDAELAEAPTAPSDTAVPDNLAYLLYTSGSTGRPKGVAVTHRSAVALVLWARETWPLDVLRGVLASTSVSFDLSVFEIFAPLGAGGRVLLVDNVLALRKMDGDQEVRLINTVPSLLAELLREGGLPASLQALNLAGEALPRSLVREIHRRAPAGCQLFNLYGPSEDTTYSTVLRVPWPSSVEDLEERDPAIGRPLPGTAAYILDSHLQPVPPGAPGELFLAGAGLARGYLGRPSLTAEKFVPDPFGGAAGARCYRTGDLARFLADGQIEFLGRIDQQVKVRGLRIELGEVEAALLRHPEVRSAVAVAREAGAGARRLVAYLVPRAEGVPAAAELRAFLRRHLPEFMIPDAFCPLPELPLTPSGKVDRRALPEPARDSGSALPASPPRTAVEVILAGLWSQLLGVGQVHREDSFFDLGGHSLLGMRMLSQIGRCFDVELALNDIFEQPTLSALAERIETAHRAGGRAAPTVVPVGRDRELPLSFAQQALWLQHQLAPTSPLYNVAGAAWLDGDLDSGALLGSLREVARRHEALRTVFPPCEGVPSQRIGTAAGAAEITLVDLRSGGESARHEAHRRALEIARRPFDLAHGPLLRVLLLRVSATSHLLVLTVHHIACDGWALRLLLREMSVLYPALRRGEPSPLPELPELPVQYADYAVWQRGWLRGEVLAEALAFWRRELASAPAFLNLPTDRPRSPALGDQGATLHFVIEAGLLKTLQALCRAQGATLFMALTGGFAALLSRLSGQEDLLLGLPVANRPRAELEPLIGCFINTMVLRVRIHDDASFGQLLQRTRAGALSAYAQAHLPFEMLVEELGGERIPGQSPFFQVMLSFQEALLPALELPGVTIAPLPVDSGTAKFDLTLDLELAGDRLAGVFRYHTGLFDRTTVERLLGHWINLLTAAAGAPDQRVQELPMLAEPERHQLLREADRTRPAPAGAEETCLHHLLAARAESDPHRTAVISGGRRLSHGELHALSSRLASRLTALGIGPEVPVGLFLERSPELVIALLAVLKAGAAYLPLDPSLPAAQLEHILTDARVPLVISRPSLIGALPPAGPALLDVEEELARGGEGTAADRGAPVAPGQLAYILYTSGSTGLPKGVAISHASLLAYLRWVGEELLTDRVRTLPWITRLSFDASLKQLFHPLLRGEAVILIEEETVTDPERLLERLRGIEGLGLNCVPSLWRALLAVVESRPDLRPHGLATLLLGGESCEPELLERSFLAFPALEIWNLYGPTEATCNVSYRRLARGAAVDLGGPVEGAKLSLLDERRRLAPFGRPGELALGGGGLARGYLHRPSLTAERFVPDPWSDEPGARLFLTGDLVRYRSGQRLELLGRLDNQVKVHGFRIELGEIETVLAKHPAVGQCVVLALRDGAGHAFLAAFLVPAPSLSPTAPELTAHLRARLPAYMVPSRFFRLEALPQTTNGKVDRQALARGDWEARALTEAYAPPETQVETRLAAIWSELLATGPIGLHDSFFALGGSSLLASQVLSRVRRDFQVEVSLRDFFQEPSLAGLAAHLEPGGSPRAALAEIPKVSRQEPLPLSLAQERFWFIDQLVPDSPAYNLPGVLDLAGAVDWNRLAASLQAVAHRQEALRLRVIERGGLPYAELRPRLPTLPLVDLSGLPPGRADAAAGDLLRSEAKRPFDLRHDPLLRALLVLHGDRRSLFLNVHHIVADGWSVAVLAEELGIHYRAFSGEPGCVPPELPIQYADYAAWQRGRLTAPALAELLSFWRDHLAGTPDTLTLPADRPRPPVQSLRGATRPLRVPAQRLRALARQRGVTLFSTLLAAFEVVLWRCSGQEDLRIGSPVSNRHRVETERLIGLFTNTLVFPARIRGEESFQGLLARTGDTVLAGLDHGEMPFERLVESLSPGRDLSRNPLFLAMFVLENAPVPKLDFAGCTARLRELATRTAKVDLTVLLREQGDDLAGDLEYSSDLFDDATIERFSRRLATVLEAVAAAPEARLEDLPAMPRSERHQVLLEWAGTAPINPIEPLGAPDLCIHQLFAAQARRTPEAVAVVSRHGELSYRELDARSTTLAGELRRLGVGPEVLVGVLLRRTPDLIVALLGILKSGGAYLPLDPAFPQARSEMILADAGAALVVTEPALAARLADGGPRTLMIEHALRPASAAPAAQVPVEPGQLAYTIYTSGSTGRPKGIDIAHRNTAAFLSWARETFPAADLARVFAGTSICFDLSVFELFLPLSCGGTIVLGDSALDLVAAVPAPEVTLLNSVPSAVRELVRLGAVPPGVRRVNLAGEPLDRRLVDDLYARLTGQAEVCNLYGPSETTTYSTWQPVPAGTMREPTIGRPIANTVAYVLSAAQEPVPIGVPGELHLGGAGLARGYRGRPELTAERFVPDPCGAPGARLYRTGDLVRHLGNGELQYLGRLDHQVKIRGFRIELGEIEALLLADPEIEEAVVLAVADAAAGPQLTAFVAGGAAERAVEGLRDRLRRQLPEYMVPARFIAVERMPQTPNGKIDRKALLALRPAAAEPGSARETAPRTPIESAVAEIWSELLTLRSIDIFTSFFDLGGHSLLATQVLSRARQRFAVDVTLQAFFADPTVAGLALAIVEAQADVTDPEELSRLIEEISKTTPEPETERAEDGPG